MTDCGHSAAATPAYEEQLDGSFDMVIREADALYGGQGRLKETYDRLSERLSSLSVPHALVGGYALILHGVRRFTEDIDLLVTESGLRQIREALLGSGYVTIPGNERNIRDAATGVRVEFIVTGQYPGDGKPKPIAFPDPDAVGQEIDAVRVVGLEALVELKLASGMTGKGRLQDLADVQRLIQTHRLSGEFAEALHPYVRAKFCELLSTT